jgi:hypothetical protein
VKEQVVYFDFNRVMWRFHPLGLQRHLSETGVDEYFERLLNQLSPDVRELISLLSCISSSGLSMDQLVILLGRPKHETRVLVQMAASTAALVTVDNQNVSISHDRPRSVAFRMIPPQSAAEIYHRVSEFLQSPAAETLANPCFGAADNALRARDLGYKADDQGLLKLLLRAGERALFMGGFPQAKIYLDVSNREW